MLQRCNYLREYLTPLVGSFCKAWFLLLELRTGRNGEVRRKRKAESRGLTALALYSGCHELDPDTQKQIKNSFGKAFLFQDELTIHPLNFLKSFITFHPEGVFFLFDICPDMLMSI